MGAADDPSVALTRNQPFDVLYIVREGERNEWLRYSLRSLVNWPHRLVWVAGYTPSWVTGVRSVPTVQQSGVRGCKDRNMTGNVIAGCRQDDATEKVVLLNDDMFFTAPGFQVGYWHSGRLADMRDSPHAGSPYQLRLVNTRRVLAEAGVDDPLMFDNMHHPTVIDRVGFLAAMSRRDGDELVFHQTVYLNLAGVESTRGWQRKVRDGASPLPGGARFVSTGPDAWAGRAGGKIRSLFPEPCRYERA